MHTQNLPIFNSQTFNEAYPKIVNHILSHGNSLGSRNGGMREVLDSHVRIEKPQKRCTFAPDRNINIFFLIAEALWIFNGERDVRFLNYFNSRMKNYSDDGQHFHAPYGWRLRKWGVKSCGEHFNSPIQTVEIDQIEMVIEHLSKNPDSRRVVMSIWNPNFDLNNYDSKDLPCNDLVVLKIRDGKLHMTIANRSNDVHWGLPTNLFQFSFIGELLSYCLGVKQGTQIHNSSSLHDYFNIDITSKMLMSKVDYQVPVACLQTIPFDYKTHESVSVVDSLGKHYQVKKTVDSILHFTTMLASQIFDNGYDVDELDSELTTEGFTSEAMGSLYPGRSMMLDYYAFLMVLYLEYKKNLLDKSMKNPEPQEIAIRCLHEKTPPNLKSTDYFMAANNFFFHRIKNTLKASNLREEFNLPYFVGKI